MSRYDFPTYPLADPAAVVSGDKFRFTVLTEGVLRYEWAEDGQFEDRASSFATIRQLPVPAYSAKTNGNVLDIVAPRFHLTYDLASEGFSPDSFKVELTGSDVMGTWHFGDPPSDLGGTVRTLDRVNGRADMGHGVISRTGFAVVDDSKSFLFESSGWIAPRREGVRVDGYLFAYGHDYRGAIHAMYQISGQQPLIPRWALGNWWSRYHPYTSAEYLGLMDTFRDVNIPLSVAVMDMDWHLVKIDPTFGPGWTGYTWNRALIADPSELMGELHARKLRTTLNDHPALGVRAFEELYPEMARAMGRDPLTGEPLEFDCTDRNYMDAFFDVVAHTIEAQGVDFWWIDWQQGTTSNLPGVDPLWILNHCHYLDSARRGQRPLTFSRYPGPGGHRYPIGFSGDTFITWESLHFQPEFTATASNIGYGWWSHDIGGHMHGYRDDELTTRWVQYGCFSPILRLHYANNPFMSREPWDLSPDAYAVVADFMRFRHRLIPYLYSMNVRSTLCGEPLVQPMYWDSPDENDAYAVPNQFRFGNQLIVAPITQPAAPRAKLAGVDAWLPVGRYVDIFDGLVYEGGRRLALHRPLDGYPVLARTGSIIPLDGADQLPNGSDLPTSIELLVVVGADGQFDLYEDDGSNEVTFAESDSGGAGKPGHTNTTTVSRTTISYDQETGALEIGATSSPNTMTPGSRHWTVRLVSHTVDESFVSLRVAHGDAVQPRIVTPRINKTAPGTVVEVGVVPSGSSATLHIGAQPELDKNDVPARCWEILFRSNAFYDRKLQLWNAINAPGSPEERWNKVESIGGLQMILDALKEVFFADSRQ